MLLQHSYIWVGTKMMCLEPVVQRTLILLHSNQYSYPVKHRFSAVGLYGLYVNRTYFTQNQVQHFSYCELVNCNNIYINGYFSMYAHSPTNCILHKIRKDIKVIYLALNINSIFTVNWCIKQNYIIGHFNLLWIRIKQGQKNCTLALVSCDSRSACPWYPASNAHQNGRIPP